MEGSRFVPKEQGPNGNHLERVRTKEVDVEGLATKPEQIKALNEALRSIGAPNVDESVKKNP